MKFIGEFYGATEGNSNVLNIDSKPGSVGFTSVLLPFVYPVSLIRVDEEGEPVRDKSGLCIMCLPGEPGEFVGKIVMGKSTQETGSDLTNESLVQVNTRCSAFV